MKRKRYQRYDGEDEAAVEIKDSTIPEVHGKGLFATRNFEKGEVVCKMKGDLMTWWHYKHKYPKGDAVYVCQIRSEEDDGYDMMIDCDEPRSCFGRYINTLTPKQMKKHKLRFNVMFDMPHDSDVLRNWFDIVSTRKISKGEELFVPYGPEYNI